MGKSARCKSCGAVIRIPSEYDAKEPRDDRFDFAEEVSPPHTAPLPRRHETRPRSRRSSRKKASQGGFPVGSLLLVVVGVFVPLFVVGLLNTTAAHIFIALAVWVGFALYLWGTISLIVGAFQESVLTGIACFFFSGIYAIYMGINDWQKVARPVKLVLTSFALYAAALTLTAITDTRGKQDVAEKRQAMGQLLKPIAENKPDRPEPAPAKSGFSAQADTSIDATSPYSLDAAASKVPHFNERTFTKFAFDSVDIYEYKTHFDTSGPVEPGDRIQLRVYLPPEAEDDHSLPCVLVPPAGTPLLTGSPIDDKKSPEHLPYVRAGYAVITFSLDGWAPDLETAKVGELSVVYRQFRDAAAGLVNARIAFLFAQQELQSVDPDRIYIAGHSSAATLALLYAAHEPDLAGCIAYAPQTDVEKHLTAFANELPPELFPGFKKFIRRSSPKTHTARIRCPVFVFHATSDSVVPFDSTKSYCDRLQSMGKDVTFVEGTVGDHYDSMISDGIPAGIEWLADQLLESGSAPPATMASRSNRSGEETPAPRLQNQFGKRTTLNNDDQHPTALDDEKAPAGTKPVTDASELAVGDRVIVNGKLFWEGARILVLLPGGTAKVHYLRLPDAFDEELPFSRIRLPLPVEEIDQELLEKLQFQVISYFGDAPPDRDAIEEDLLQMEGYIADSLELDPEAMRVALQVIRGSRAEKEAVFSLLRFKFSTRPIEEQPRRGRSR